MALIRFHWAAGARVALRANALTLGMVVFAFGYAPEALNVLRHFILGVVAVTQFPDEGARMTLAGIAAALAMAAVPRVSLGSAGWMQSLPLDRRLNWRAAVVAATAVQMAIAAFVLIASVMAAVVYRAPVSPAKVLTIPLMMLGVAATVTPARHSLGRLVAAGAGAAAIAGTWRLGFVALVLLALTDAIVGGIPASRPRRQMVRSTAALVSGSSAMAMWVHASWRAIGVPRLVGSALLPGVPTSFAYFLTRNNPDFSPQTAALVIRVCGGVALAMFVAGPANALLQSRQPWPWARSLPWSSTYRVVADVLVIGVPLIAVPIALLPLAPLQALIVAAMVPITAAFGAAALRGTARRQTGAAGEAIIFALVACVGVGFWPALSVVALGLTPLVVRWAAARDRAWRVTRWSELHHNAAGDPTWLSRP